MSAVMPFQPREPQPMQSAHLKPTMALHGDRASQRLRFVLLGLDALAMSVAWTLVVLASFTWRLSIENGIALLGFVALCVVLGFVAHALQGLYRARVCEVRSVELAGIARGALLVAVSAGVLGPSLGVTLTLPALGAGLVLVFIVVSAVRTQFAWWLRAQRVQGRHRRRVVIVGGGADADELLALVADHPDLGYDVCGIVAPGPAVARAVPTCTDVNQLERFVRASGANGALICDEELGARQRSQLTRRLLAIGIHVQIMGALSDVAPGRLRSVPLGHVPAFYVERVGLSRTQRALKHAVDVSVSIMVLLVALPIMALAALAIWLEDRGPVLFRQQRVGKDGRMFAVLKFRTMSVDAEQRVVDLGGANERQGPLFKVSNDPRRTKVGRWLESASLDELPQLMNVLRGEMSLVGPRPALPREVEQFDDELRERVRVLPGVTGLWQVEARDNPSFGAYRRLDLFYVENWSLGLDCVILAETFHAVVARALRKLIA